MRWATSVTDSMPCGRVSMTVSMSSCSLSCLRVDCMSSEYSPAWMSVSVSGEAEMRLTRVSSMDGCGLLVSELIGTAGELSRLKVTGVRGFSDGRETAGLVSV